MKIKAVRISGFRGIPPHVTPAVDLSFAARNTHQDVLIFGPNAFGKSSIADSLEWFFKENVRGSTYFENYVDTHNVHLNLGIPPHPDKAFIELDVSHNGNDHTIRKELNSSGQKSNEALDGLDAVLAKCADEIVVLDHDQFRKFVGAASKEKWSSFSSLIGYEELDNFRAGLDSATGNSLNAHLDLTARERTSGKNLANWNAKLSNVFTRYRIPAQDASLNVLSETILGELAIFLESVNKPIPASIDVLDLNYWRRLRNEIRPDNPFQAATLRLGQLDNLTTALAPLPYTFDEQLSKLLEVAARLDAQKDQFDKQLLAQFYSQGLKVINSDVAVAGQCPLCDTPYPWNQLEGEVQERLNLLDFDAISKNSDELKAHWKSIKSDFSSYVTRLKRARLPNVTASLALVLPLAEVENATALESFDLGIIQIWRRQIQTLQHDVRAQFDLATIEHDKQRAEMPQNPVAPIIQAIDRLKDMWEEWQSLNQEFVELSQVKAVIDATKTVVASLRDAARKFRGELDDFSGRVVNLINADVNAYYEALHPNDGVYPFLETQVRGNQRSVQLKCSYLGTDDCEAATLLSESHRNSLGLAIMLAFMKYKRRAGSPVEFLILDDVTQSFDVGHRLSLIHFLENPAFPEIYNSQIIFLTHDRTLADLIMRPAEQRDNWLRYDIRSWQLNGMKIEPSDVDLIQRGRDHLANGDELAAAVYGRHALEFVYRCIVENGRILMPYNAKPWKTGLDVYQKHIIDHVTKLWGEDIVVGGNPVTKGIIDPSTIQNRVLDTSLRLLHFTVHDSDFLQNPPSLREITTALNAVETFRNAFTCQHCRSRTTPEYNYFKKLEVTNQGQRPNCRKCNQQV